MKVGLLDDRKSPLPGSLREQAHKQLVEILNQAASGAVRARALPVGEQPQLTSPAFDEHAH